MTPTVAQLEAIALAVARVQTSPEAPAIVVEEDRDVARAAWEVIAPMVLEGAEDAVSECGVERCECERRIRALK